ncbi:MAG: hypothetical protein KKB66_16055 [Alphaproteobacteria bacterium]|nr:hypothetical protein [Alphaproteobacteria bacterium]MBU0804311.1 hypothetical protein [Alphaproteobacteria bacterium]MBU0871142.1 hypothetical protein [Alphaproteobacteria bacterium]MBU1400897.1 hypothetical protein [Alphaproteobacteria bacterium]MBU1592686.1 hypothetical protein [Alphaproteobacteria bacterium]
MPLAAAGRSVFHDAELYFPIIESVLLRVQRHRYAFLSDEWYRQQVEIDALSVADRNQIVALDLIEKAHLAAVTSLIRIKRWADAAILMHSSENFLGFCGALRGLIEHSGDTVDGLLNLGGSIAANHRTLSQMFKGKVKKDLVDCSAMEAVVDHYIHAGWVNQKSVADRALAAKPNVEYVRLVERALPGAVTLYHRLCAIVHPSNASISWLYQFDPESGLLMVVPNDSERISSLCNEFPEAASVTLQLACNSALITLRVLHKFGHHPQLPELKGLDWRGVKFASEIEGLLRK